MFSNEVDIDENIDAANPEVQDCHSLPPDWAGGAPEFSPAASLSPDLEFLPEPEPDPATIAHHKVDSILLDTFSWQMRNMKLKL